MDIRRRDCPLFSPRGLGIRRVLTTSSLALFLQVGRPRCLKFEGLRLSLP